MEGLQNRHQQYVNSIADLSETVTLLKGSIDSGRLDEERSERVKRCLQSCEVGLVKLLEKSQKLRKNGELEGFRQKRWTQLQRLCYPFRASTLGKLRKIVDNVRERLKLAI